MHFSSNSLRIRARYAMWGRRQCTIGCTRISALQLSSASRPFVPASPHPGAAFHRCSYPGGPFVFGNVAHGCSTLAMAQRWSPLSEMARWRFLGEDLRQHGDLYSHSRADCGILVSFARRTFSWHGGFSREPFQCQDVVINLCA